MPSKFKALGCLLLLGLGAGLVAGAEISTAAPQVVQLVRHAESPMSLRINAREVKLADLSQGRVTIDGVTLSPAPGEGFNIRAAAKPIQLEVDEFVGWTATLPQFCEAGFQIPIDKEVLVILMTAPPDNADLVKVTMPDGASAKVAKNSTTRFEAFKDGSYTLRGQGDVVAQNAEGKTIKLVAGSLPLTGGPLVEVTDAKGTHMSRVTPTTLIKVSANGLIPAGGLTPAEQIAQAEVRSIIGTARFANSDGIWRPLSKGVLLFTGASIQTDHGSKVDLFLGENGQFLHIQEDTTVALDKLQLKASAAITELNVKAGRILGNVKKLAAGSRYEIKTPTGVAGIRGTEYVISSVGEIICLSGLVQYTEQNANGRSPVHSVAPQQMFNPQAGSVQTVPPAVASRWQLEFTTGAGRIGQPTPSIQRQLGNAKTVAAAGASTTPPAGLAVQIGSETVVVSVSVVGEPQLVTLRNGSVIELTQMGENGLKWAVVKGDFRVSIEQIPGWQAVTLSQQSASATWDTASKAVDCKNLSLTESIGVSLPNNFNARIDSRATFQFSAINTSTFSTAGAGGNVVLTGAEGAPVSLDTGNQLITPRGIVPQLYPNQQLVTMNPTTTTFDSTGKIVTEGAGGATPPTAPGTVNTAPPPTAPLPGTDANNLGNNLDPTIIQPPVSIVK